MASAFPEKFLFDDERKVSLKQREALLPNHQNGN